MDEPPCHAMSLVGNHETLRHIVHAHGHCWVRRAKPFLHVQFTKRLVTRKMLRHYEATPVNRAFFLAPWHCVLRDDYLTPDEPERAQWEHCALYWDVATKGPKGHPHTKIFTAQLPINYWTKRAIARSLEHHGVGDWVFKTKGGLVTGATVHTVSELRDAPLGRLTVKLFLN